MNRQKNNRSQSGPPYSYQESIQPFESSGQKNNQLTEEPRNQQNNKLSEQQNNNKNQFKPLSNIRTNNRKNNLENQQISTGQNNKKNNNQNEQIILKQNNSDKNNRVNEYVGENELNDIEDMNDYENNNFTKNNNKEFENLKNNENNENLKNNENKRQQNNNKNNKTTVEKMSSLASGMFNKASEITTETTSNETLMLIFKVLLGILLFVVLINIIKYFYLSYEDSATNNPWLIEGTKNGKHALVISQNPEHTNYLPVKRSDGLNGIEFTYSFWFLVEDFGYKQGEWKHIFHKGSPTSYPNRSPGVWLHPNTNSIRVYMNTLKEPLEFVDIENIPLRKWVHMVIIIKNKVMEIYFNGFIKKRKEFDSLPRQNNGDIWVNLFGGFEGYVSNMRYFSKAITAGEIDKMISLGPSQASCIDTGEKPPYFEDRWWF